MIQKTTVNHVKIGAVPYLKIRTGRVNKIVRLYKAEREGLAMQTARQWLPVIKSKAQVKRKRKSLQQLRLELEVSGKAIKRGSKPRMMRHRHENPLDFALSPESKAIAESTAGLEALFGPILQPVVSFRPRRGRLTNTERKAMESIDLDSI